MNVELKTMGSPVGPRMVINGREVDYYCGTSYYTLHGDRRVIDGACEAVRRYGLGPATMMNTPPHREVIERASAFFGTQTATYVISGYLADLVLLQALCDDYDVVLVDERSHYSVFDGLYATGKRLVQFRHLDANDLAHKLRGEVKPGQIPLVMSDGIFPSTGAIAPLRDYVEVLALYDDPLLCIDDSHALGVIGANGQGTYEYLDLRGANRYLAGTLAKAFGGVGGIVPGSQDLKKKIKQHSRVPIGASSASVAAAAAAAMGLRILSEHPEMRKQLWSNVARVREGLRKLGLDVGTSPVPIVSIQSTPSLDVKRLLHELDKQDIVVAHVAARGYSDAPDVESLRIAVFSTHTKAQIDRLLEAIGKLL
jgi:7-keto-8-aminopelargonate synthetase-like enzyme